MAKMGNKMIALCSSAIGAVYLAGFVSSQPDQSAAVPHTHTDHTNTKTDTPANGAKPPRQVSKNSVPTNKVYKDGTFIGQATNHIGSVEVAVTFKKDKITDVEITNCDTHYSPSYIQDLPQQVLIRQSANVDIVSGATLSTEDFQQAVDDCIQQAKI
ncbi:Uncharacterized protein, contains FMN-binding domain [Fictibacillus enclensis]|uniref:FMN-binding domain-containing protein n=1 Tax=Fictibacillus enclensis TaxID=1017270 RepID=A0A0V8J8C5_9BACL|nr:FMN-binding protein [Fictibacillus enclensis]KSU83162.1 hypothetical protein AS030_11290 [Fictibacillus enclensis]SCC11106.1 Uncharacterized protein, contains FMN-binding domain [Fictibacillus enclensis]